MITGAIAKLVEFCDLTEMEAVDAISEIMMGAATPAQIGTFLSALRMKGETSEEIAAFARVMRARAIRITPRVMGTLVDTCGTGGDGTGTFNISTAAAFVAAGAGVPVVKHGNRGVSSRCGSADVLKALGVNIRLPPRMITGIVEDLGIAFLFAPEHHPAMKCVAGVRRELGVRTVFNLLGPLLNPAGAEAQVIGVYSPDLTRRLAEVLGLIGLERGMVVHGEGMDEITTTGVTCISELQDRTIRDYTIDSLDFGIPRAETGDLAGGDAAENARILLAVLEGERGAHRDIVVLNAGAAIYIGGAAGSIAEGIGRAEQAVDSGSALGKLNRLIEVTGSMA